MSEFGQEIRRLRKARRWSQEELGGRAETDQSTISAIEVGRSIPGPPTVTRLAEALRQDVHAFMVLAGHLPAEATTQPESSSPIQASPNDGISDQGLDRQERLRYVESRPGEHFQAQLAVLREDLTPAQYEDLLLRIFAAWEANSELALGVYALGR